MMSWSMQALDSKAVREITGGLSGSRKPYDPIVRMSTFIAQCREKGLSRSETIGAVESGFRYFPLEAELVVNDFWK